MITVTVYPNRHLRADRTELNDMSGHYISMRAVQALMNAGTQFKFIKETKTRVDVTAEMTKRVYRYVQQKGKTLKRDHLGEFDAYGNK